MAVFPDASGLLDSEMQALAAEFNLSETTFVLPPDDPRHTARVRIFNRTTELAFAGHPTLGTGYVLARDPRGRCEGDLTIEVPAGIVQVRIERDDSGTCIGGVISAPLPLSTGATLPVKVVAASAGLKPQDVLTGGHAPTLASMGNPFIIAEVTPEALGRARPNLQSFQDALEEYSDLKGRYALHLYAHAKPRLRARMFAPAGGTYEDPATGSANAALAGLLLSLSDEKHCKFEVIQGMEMGRSSLLKLTATRAADGIRATVGGGCVPVLSGEALV